MTAHSSSGSENSVPAMLSRLLSRWRYYLNGAFREVSSSLLTTVFISLSIWLFGLLFFPEAMGQSGAKWTTVVALLGIALAVGHLFCNHELRKPLGFLSGIPSRPYEVFLSRVIMVWLAGLTLLLIDHLLNQKVTSILQTSISKAEPVDSAIAPLLSACLFVFLASGYAVGISSLRAGYIVGILIWALGGVFFPAPLKYLFAMSITEGFSRGTNGGIHFGYLAFQSAFAMAGYALGCTRYHPTFKKSFDLKKWIERTFPVRVTASVIRFGLIGLVVISLGMLLVRTQSEPRLIQETESFQYSYSQEDSELIGQIRAIAETELDRMSARFSIDQDEIGKIMVFMTNSFDDSGAGGVAFWKSMRLSRSALSGKFEWFKPDDVFRHELSHVLTEILCEGTFKRHGVKVKAFHEGLATYMENSDHPEELTGLQKHRLLSGMIREEWNPLPLDQLLAFDGEALDKHGVRAAYQHGFILIQALVERFGEDAPFQVLKASTRLQRKTVLYNSEAFWHTLLHEAGYSYLDLEQTYYSRIEALKVQLSDKIASMPPPKTTITWTDEGCEIRHSGRTATQGANFVVYIDGINAAEENGDSEEDAILGMAARSFRANDQGVVTIPLEKFKGKFNRRYAAGWSHPDLPTPVMAGQGTIKPPAQHKENQTKTDP